jgi:hypothetical protein
MTIDQPLEPVVTLDPNHDISGFDCGQADLNSYLQKYALANQQNRSGRTYVVARGHRVVGFYTVLNTREVFKGYALFNKAANKNDDSRIRLELHKSDNSKVFEKNNWKGKGVPKESFLSFLLLFLDREKQYPCMFPGRGVLPWRGARQ